MHVASEGGGDRVLASRRELVDSATEMMVAGDFYDGKPLIDLSEQELRKGFERFAGVDVLQTNDVFFLLSDLSCAEDAYECAGRQQGAHAQVCSAEIPC